jgi:hypothetical protein
VAGVNLAAVQASAALMNFFPMPSTGSALGPNGCPVISQVVNTLPLEHNRDTFGLGRVDYQISQNQALFARYLIQTGYGVHYVNDVFAQFPPAQTPAHATVHDGRPIYVLEWNAQPVHRLF